ncbi:polyubiquitin-like isoform X2 [Actinidia eriantha]|uniref:polyubiquitin-like isoform X2 n=1 Tax=Actinidia eriantha TaxID=165200 RepID=UPI002590EBA5|nr:polyubiquitin-like isoform X2 [Actinidia eriantha]
MESREKEMNIILEINKTVSIKVKSSETIKNLKSILHKKEGISENLPELFLAGEELKDNQKLLDYGIQTNSILHIVLRTVKFFVNIPSYPKTFELEVKTQDTIRDVKTLIEAKEGIQSDLYSLFYGGKLLADNRTLSSLELQPESTLYLVFNPRDELSVFFKMPAGEIVKAEVKLLYTISDVKAIIGSMIGFSVSDQNLIYAGNALEDWKTLACYNIRENFILEVLPRTFQIFVKAWNGKTVILDVHPKETVLDIKDKIFNKLRIPVKVQSLVFAGKSLENYRDLGSYNIQKNSTLHMVFSPATLVRRMTILDIGCPLPLPRCTTVRNLKGIIERKMKKRVKELFMNEVKLKDNRSLVKYGITEETTFVAAMEVL